MFEAKLNDLTAQNEQLRQRIEEHEREKEMLERTHQSRLDEITQTLQQEKSQHQECRTRFSNEKDKAENLQRQVNRSLTSFDSIVILSFSSSMKLKIKSIQQVHKRQVNRFDEYLLIFFFHLDIEQQLGDYEKQIKMLRVKLDAANNELERKDFHCMISDPISLVCSSQTNINSIRN